MQHYIIYESKVCLIWITGYTFVVCLEFTHNSANLDKNAILSILMHNNLTGYVFFFFCNDRHLNPRESSEKVYQVY